MRGTRLVLVLALLVSTAFFRVDSVRSEPLTKSLQGISQDSRNSGYDSSVSCSGSNGGSLFKLESGAGMERSASPRPCAPPSPFPCPFTDCYVLNGSPCQEHTLCSEWICYINECVTRTCLCSTEGQLFCPVY